MKSMKRVLAATEEEVERLAEKLNREASSPEFRPFFINIDRKHAREQLAQQKRNAWRTAHANTP